jgi:amino acid adenylation domain-containing protein
MSNETFPVVMEEELALVAAPADEVFVAPTSFAQRRLWLLDRLQPGLAAYNVPFAMRLLGDLDGAQLARALGEVAARHEVLRTALEEEEEGEPVQVILPLVEVPLPLVDLGALPAGRAEAAARQTLASESRRPFDLARAPLLQALLVRLRDREHLFFLNQHHVATDGWSLGILLRELLDIYVARRDGRRPRLAELPIQYADYAAWQRQWLAGQALEIKLLPWRRRLAGAPVTLALPTDRPGPHDGHGGLFPFSLPGDLAAALHELARASGATFFMILLASFQALLCRISGQDDVVVGTPVANRGRLETENLLGCFVNTLALRGEMADDPTFEKLLARTREVVVEAFAHEDLPFEKLVEELRPDRRLDANPLFRTLLAVQPPALAPDDPPGLALEPFRLHAGTTKFDLALHVEPGDEPVGFWEYAAALFDRTTVQRLDGHWRTLLADAAGHPGRRVSELALFAAPERHQLLVEWNGVALAAPLPVACLHELLAAQAARSPNAIALTAPSTAGETALTYRELDERAGRLARRLRAAGVGPEVGVGLCSERSPALVVGLLGILKAGGAYVPLDPAYPRERLAFLLADARCSVVVVERGVADRLPETTAALVELAEVVEIDADGNGGDEAAPAGEPVRVDPANLAYVIHTSGSTGTPKGAMVTHANAARLFAGLSPYFGCGAGDVWALFHSYAFDFSVWEIWGALLAGGRLVVVPPAVARSPEALGELLRRERVTVLNQTPSAFAALAERLATEPEERFPRSLRWIVFGGEALQFASLSRWYERRGDSEPRLANLYGITETTVHATLRPLAAADAAATASAIGRPLPDLAVHLLGPGLAPLPIGAAGEMYVGGAGLCRGYLGRPELTAARFVPDPFAPAAGGRLYRTGDLARRLPDGGLEFLGRVDDQVKIRGFRIEPAEVEAALAAHPAVVECAVVARRGATGEPALAAYLVSRQGGSEPLSPRQLRDFLAARLPEHMVPAAFVAVAGLPRTPSGKLDRAVLPDPGREETAAAGFVAPRTPVEEVLAGIWSSVLRLDRIGAHDNFFDLGGHSLTATSVTAQARSTFQVELPARALFESPALAELAERIERLLVAAGGLDLPPVTPVPRGFAAGGTLEAPLSFAQQRLWFLDELAGGASPFYNVSAALALDGPLALPALAAAGGEIVRRHEALRTTFRAGLDGRPVQVIRPPRPRPLPVVDLTALPAAHDSEAARVTRREAGRAFDLARGPLLRLFLLRLAPERHVLMLSMHHIVSDGWSLEVFVRELAALYAAFRAGRPSPLAPLPVQYADFAVWQRRWLAGPVLDAQLAYWRRQLAGAPTVLEIATDRPRPAVQGHRGDSVALHLPAPLVEALRTVARDERATLFMALLAAFAAFLGRYTGQRDLLVGTPSANRNRAEIEGLIGFFVNLLVLRADLGDDPGFRRLLSRVREVALAAYAHQDLPFERLVEELAPRRELSRSPLFQASFSLGSTPWTALELPGLARGVLDVGGGGAELFDLTLRVVDSPEGFVAYLAYDVDLFDRPTIVRMGRHLQELLAGLAAAPGRPLATAPLLAAPERHQLLVEWSGRPACREPRDTEPASTGGAADVAALFAAQAARRPHAAALSWTHAEMTYEELNRRANRLAHHLRALGVGPEVVVALSFDAPVDFVLGLLAALKAGGAFLPLDPKLPRERLDALLAGSDARFAVTRAGLAPLPAGLATVDLDADAAAVAAASPDDPPPLAPPAALAYVLYTSGSTGGPKGVMIARDALAAHCLASQERRPLTPADRALQSGSFAFDLTLDQVLTALTAGAAVLPWEAEETGPAALARALDERGATVVHLTTALWHQAAREWAAGRALPRGPRVRWVETGGEALPAGSLRLWRGTPLAGVPLTNSYGPTEATVLATAATAAPGADSERDLESLPIGRPVARHLVCLLGADGEPPPLGAAGEIHLGGPALARGYRGRPDLTAAAFVPDPFAGPEAPGSRLYRTGDLARHLADGRLEFLGRHDVQLKVRGFRIEPAEVEAALLAHPRVSAAAVVAVDGADGPDARRLVAYFVAAPEGAPAEAELRAFLAERLPSYMVPAACLPLPALPLTTTGKVDRAALRERPAAAAPAPPPPAPAVPAAAPVTPEVVLPLHDPLETLVTDLWRELLDRPEVDPDDNFFDLGGHSLLMTLLRARLQQALGVDLAMLDVFNHPTVRTLTARLRREVGDRLTPPAPQPAPAVAPAARAEPARGDDVAVVAMAGRFPGVDDGDVERFWRNLQAGVDAVTFFLAGGREAWRPPDVPLFEVPAKGVVAGADLFDADFFGIDGAEAELLDPQHRLFLECCWEALESAGYDAEKYPGSIGVFGGASKRDYLLLLAEAGRMADAEASTRALRGNEHDLLATRTAYKLGLRGPSLTVQNGCASSLVAVHLACRSLLAGDCDVALAGGVSISALHRQGYLYHRSGFLSADGRTRAFAAGSTGSVDSDGAAVVVLKRLADAVADGDAVRAVIKGTALNNDGAERAGLTVPGVAGREQVVRAALARAGFGADTVTYVEAHGNATPEGDVIEVAALARAFAADGARRGSCGLGSVKTSIGHANGAGGAIGLIKTVLAMEHRQLPPNLHYERPNPEINLAGSPFFVNDRLRDWQASGPRRAGVNSFGIGGINVHVVLEEAPPFPAPADGRPWQLLVLSARTESALAAATARLAGHLEAHPGLHLPDVAWTLQVGRRDLAHRRTVLCRQAEGVTEAAAALRAPDPQRVATGVVRRRNPSLCFLFPAAPAAGLDGGPYRDEPAFRIALERCRELLRPELSRRLADLFAAPAEAAPAEQPLPELALFAFEYALAQTWRAWGLRPQALFGEGAGEYVAACLAGALPLEDALGLIVARGVQPGRFAAALTPPPRDPARLLFEVGAAGSADELRRRLFPEGAAAVVSCLPSSAAAGDTSGPVSVLGRLWLGGAAVDWAAYHAGEQRHRLPLPTYPFERRRYWVELPRDAERALGEREVHEGLASTLTAG